MKKKVRTRIDSLRPLLKDPMTEVKAAAAEAIEKLEAASSVDEILAALKTGNMGSKIGAIYALGEIGGDNIFTPLAYCAKRPEVGIRAAAVAVLGRLALPAAYPLLVDLLDDVDPIIQSLAIAALRNYAVTAAVLNKLRPFLNASDGVLEAEAAMTLAVLGDLHSLEKIGELLMSLHASTRQAAATALSRMPFQ